MSDTKTCIKCNMLFELKEFVKYKKSSGNIGYKNVCKRCTYTKNSENFKKWYSTENGKEKKKKSEQKYNDKKRELNRIKREALLKEREEIKKEKDRLRQIRVEKINENKKLKEEKRLQWEEKKKYWATDEFKKEKRERYNMKWKKKWENDELFAIKVRLRNLVRNSFRRTGYKKFSIRTEDIVGMNYDEFKKYIESKFQDGMTWENRGEWHIDHIIPLSSAKSREDLLRLSHYTNLQPLWAADNLRKQNKIIG